MACNVPTEDMSIQIKLFYTKYPNTAWMLLIVSIHFLSKLPFWTHKNDEHFINGNTTTHQIYINNKNISLSYQIHIVVFKLASSKFIYVLLNEKSINWHVHYNWATTINPCSHNIYPNN